MEETRELVKRRILWHLPPVSSSISFVTRPLLPPSKFPQGCIAFYNTIKNQYLFGCVLARYIIYIDINRIQIPIISMKFPYRKHKVFLSIFTVNILDIMEPGRILLRFSPT